SFVYFILRTQRTTAPDHALAGTNVIANASLSARLIADRSGPSVPGAWPGPGNGVCGADCRAESTHASPPSAAPHRLYGVPHPCGVDLTASARKDSRIQLTLTPGRRPPKARSPATASGAPPSQSSLLKKVASFLQRIPAPVRVPVLVLAQELAEAADPVVRAPRAWVWARAWVRAPERAWTREEAQARVPEQEWAPERLPAQERIWASIQVQHAWQAAVLLPPAPRPCA
ncbi:hypothetical protein Ctob_008923, partial [Chrysochromulina tobinii]